MKPIEILKEEHQVIIKALKIIDFIANSMEKGVEFPLEELENLIDFIKNFADKCHHAKEEKLLFKKMVEYGVPEKGGPISVMLYEHDLGRDYVRNMEIAMKDKKLEKANFIKNARLYASLLNDHINKEDNILYVIADMHIDNEGQTDLLKEFERVEREEIGKDVHEKYHNLIMELESKYGRK